MSDVIDAVLGSAVAAAVAPIRQTRPVVITHTQGVHDALFDGPSGLAFGRARLAAIAVRVANLAEAKELAAHYNSLDPTDVIDEFLAASLRHAERLTLAPATSTHAHIDELYAAGLTDRDIVTLTQLIGYVNYQVRLLAGLTLIGAGHE